MPEAALALYVVYGLLAFGLRSLLQLRATGSAGFHGVGGKVGSAEWLAGAGFAVAILLGFAAPIAALAGLEPIGSGESESLFWAGLVIALAGIAATVVAQISMGDSWRIGVDPAERTRLVTVGAFRLVRNPIFAAMIPTALGLALMVPNVLAAAGFAGLLIALELQVRIVEEPYLRVAHGETYGRYASRVGRFVPGVGRLAEPARVPER